MFLFQIRVQMGAMASSSSCVRCLLCDSIIAAIGSKYENHLQADLASGLAQYDCAENAALADVDVSL